VYVSHRDTRTHTRIHTCLRLTSGSIAFCVYVSHRDTHIHSRTHTCTRIHTCTLAYMPAHTHTHTYTLAHIPAYAHTPTLSHTYLHTHSHVHSHTHICTRTHTYTLAHIPAHAHTHIQVVYLYIIHTHQTPMSGLLCVCVCVCCVRLCRPALCARTDLEASMLCVCVTYIYTHILAQIHAHEHTFCRTAILQVWGGYD